jgi:NADPH:quinone reductase-like Zn-dependent oxidoreductase
VLDETLVPSPGTGFCQAATLTCAGTGRHALFGPAACARATLLLLGTGGVSIWALQLARAAGVRVIITSSSDEKLERARAMGADGLINYSKNSEWSGEVRRLTGGEGVDVVLEVGGEKTAPQSLASVRMQGTVVIIGGVSGFGGAINPRSLIVGATRVQCVCQTGRCEDWAVCHHFQVEASGDRVPAAEAQTPSLFRGGQTFRQVA